MRLFQVIGDICAHEIAKSGIEELQLRLVEAICLCELHLPGLMADIKMHGAMHIVFRQLRNFGEQSQEGILPLEVVDSRNSRGS